VLRIALECHVLGVVELPDRVDESDHTRVDQVLQIHVNREVVMHADRYGTHQRKVLDHRPIPRIERFRVLPLY
jgi:hypothetical protein